MGGVRRLNPAAAAAAVLPAALLTLAWNAVLGRADFTFQTTPSAAQIINAQEALNVRWEIKAGNSPDSNTPAPDLVAVSLGYLDAGGNPRVLFPPISGLGGSTVPVAARQFTWPKIDFSVFTGNNDGLPPLGVDSRFFVSIADQGTGYRSNGQVFAIVDFASATAPSPAGAPALTPAGRPPSPPAGPEGPSGISSLPPPPTLSPAESAGVSSPVTAPVDSSPSSPPSEPLPSTSVASFPDSAPSSPPSEPSSSAPVESSPTPSTTPTPRATSAAPGPTRTEPRAGPATSRAGPAVPTATDGGTVAPPAQSRPPGGRATTSVRSSSRQTTRTVRPTEPPRTSKPRSRASAAPASGESGAPHKTAVHTKQGAPPRSKPTETTGPARITTSSSRPTVRPSPSTAKTPKKTRTTSPTASPATHPTPSRTPSLTPSPTASQTTSSVAVTEAPSDANPPVAVDPTDVTESATDSVSSPEEEGISADTTGQGGTGADGESLGNALQASGHRPAPALGACSLLAAAVLAMAW